MTEPTWKQSILYLASIYAILYLVHSSILHKLLLGHEKLHVKRRPVLPLRFRSDGTFKILQVRFFSATSSAVLALGFCWAWSRISCGGLVLQGGRYALCKWGHDSVQGRVGVWVRGVLWSQHDPLRQTADWIWKARFHCLHGYCHGDFIVVVLSFLMSVSKICLYNG